jgi:hypothetical protein
MESSINIEALEFPDPSRLFAPLHHSARYLGSPSLVSSLTRLSNGARVQWEGYPDRVVCIQQRGPAQVLVFDDHISFGYSLELCRIWFCLRLTSHQEPFLFESEP